MSCKHLISLKLCLLLAALATGCTTSTTPVLDARHGDALRSTRQAQTLDPKAPTGNNPVLGMDGKAAVNAQERYQDSFKSPPKTFDVMTTGGTQSGQ
jgi:hypothetical protein